MNNQLPKILFQFIVHFLKAHPMAVGVLIGLSMLSGTYGTINSYLMKILVDYVAIIGNQNADLFKALFLPALFFILNYETHNLSWRGVQYITIKTGPEIQNQIIREMFAYAEKNSFRFFQDNFSGTIASNISTIADNIFVMVTNIAPFLIRQTMQTTLALITMFFIHPLFSAVFAIWVVFFVMISLFCSKRIMSLSDVLAMSHSKLSGKITDSISNSNNVRLFSREQFEVNYLNGFLDDVADKFRKKEWFSLKLSLVQGLSITLLIAVLLFVLIKLKMHNLVTVGDFAFILGLGLYVTEGVWYFMEQIHRLNDLIGHSNQSLRMIMIPQEITDSPQAKNIHVSNGEIVFQDVTFQYKRHNNLFENKSVLIKGGQRVGLVGFSGSGKTTFVNLIVRLFDLSSGVIKIDNQNIRQVTQQSLRENIGFIPQDPVLFHRSLMENIRYGKIDASDEEVIQAAIKAHAHEFISLTPDGYQSLVGERGIKLSGGQRQRISIARAILKNAPILILDEATSALDSVTEGYIQDSLRTLMQGKTVIVIAHRLSTLLEMDRILVFDKGKIIEEGTHQSLMSKQGMYSVLWNSQVGGFLLDEDSDKAEDADEKG